VDTFSCSKSEFEELKRKYLAEKKERKTTPLNDDEKIELACQLNKLWIKEK